MKYILIIENSKTFGNMVKKQLESELKLPVIWTKTLAETLQTLKTKGDSILAAVLDFNLPDAPNGEAIAEVVKYGIPSIIFTETFSEKIRDFVWSKNVADYIPRSYPNSLEYIATSIRRLIKNIKIKVLVVDDSPLFRKVISDRLTIHQFQVLTANNAFEALDIIKKNPAIKLVITDFNMPDMDGCLLCQKIRQDHKKEELAIIGISSEGNKDMAANFIKSGANDFLVKQSFIAEEFYCRVNQCLDNIDLIFKTKEAAIKDFLTGLHNRRYFFEAGNNLFASAIRENISICCAMIDIDFFKNVNDHFGHNVGDLVLKQVAHVIQKRMRTSDLVARLGGEEFCILAVNMDKNSTKTVFNDIRSRIEDNKVFFNNGTEKLSVTVSIGVCTGIYKNLDAMLKKADDLLYEAKTDGGRNCVMISD